MSQRTAEAHGELHKASCTAYFSPAEHYPAASELSSLEPLLACPENRQGTLVHPTASLVIDHGVATDELEILYKPTPCSVLPTVNLRWGAQTSGKEALQVDTIIVTVLKVT